MKRIFKDGYMNVGTLEEAPYNRVVSIVEHEGRLLKACSLRGVIGIMVR